MKRTLLLASAIFMLGGAVAQGKTAVVRQDSPTIEAPVSNSTKAYHGHPGSLKDLQRLFTEQKPGSRKPVRCVEQHR